MDDANLATEFLSGTAGKSPDNPATAFLHPEVLAPEIVGQARRDLWSQDRLREGLKDYGIDPSLADSFEQEGKLNERRRQLQGTGISTGQAFRRNFMPFSDVSSLNFLGGGRVVGNAEYGRAQKRFAEGTATQDDIDAIATYEHHAGVDKLVREKAKRGGALGFGQQFALEMGSLGKMGLEMAAGGAALGRIKALRGGGTLAPQAGEVARVPGVAAELARGPVATVARDVFGTKMPLAAMAPSFWVPMMQQNNAANGRDANDPQGFPSAFAYATANLAVLGRLAKGTLREGSFSGPFDMLKKGVAGVVELNAVDAVAGMADNILPKAWQVKPTGENKYGTIVDWARAIRAGDADKAGEKLREVTTQMLSFATFAGLHGNQKVPEGIMKSYQDTFYKLRESGVPRDKAVEELRGVHEKVESALSENPFMTREQAREAALKDTPQALREYALWVTDGFVPKEKQPASPESPIQREVGPTGATTTTRMTVDGQPVAPPEAKQPPRVVTAEPVTTVATPPEAVRPQATPEFVNVRDVLEKGGNDPSTAFEPLLARVSEALGRGESVRIWLDGQPKDIASVSGGMMRDASGNPWGFLPLSMGKRGTKTGIEFGGPKTQPTQPPVASKAKPPTVSPTLDPNDPVAVLGEAKLRDIAKALSVPLKKADQPHGVLAKIMKNANGPKAIANYMARRNPAATVATTPVEAAPEKQPLPSEPSGVPQEAKTPEPSTSPPEAPVRPADAKPEATGGQPDQVSSPGYEILKAIGLDAKGYEGGLAEADTAGRKVVIEHHPERNSIEVLFDRSDESADFESLGPGGNREAVEIGRVIRKVAVEAKRRGLAVEYDTNGKREGVYDRILTKLGFEEVLDRSNDDGKHYWKPVEKPAAPKSEPQAKPEAATVATPAETPKQLDPRIHDLASQIYGVQDSIAKVEAAIAAVNKSGRKPGPAVARSIELLPQYKNRLAVLEAELESAHKTRDSLATVATPETKASPESRAIEAAEDNLAGLGKSRPDAERFKEYTNRWLELPPGEYPELEKRIAAAGGKRYGTPGETVPFDPALHAETEGVARGTPAVVERPGWLYKSEKYPAGDYKAVVRPATVAREAEAVNEYRTAKAQALWDELTPEERAKLPPEQVEAWREMGVDLDSQPASDRAESVKASKQSAIDKSEFLADVTGMEAAGKLSTFERRFLELIADGNGYRDVSKMLSIPMGGSMNRMAAKIAAKLGKEFPEKYGDWKTTNDLFRELSAERIDAAARMREWQETDIDPATGEKRGTLFGGLPFELGFLKRLFSPRGVTPGRSLTSRLVSKITGDLPKEVREARAEEVTARIAAYVFDVQNVEKDLHAVLTKEGTPYDTLSQDRLLKLDRVLRGEIVPRMAESPELLAVIDRMRSEVDKLSSDLIKIGAVPAPMVATVANNIGQYLTRQYEVFRDPAWESKVDPQVVNRFKSWFTQEYVNQYGRQPTPEHVEGAMKELLRDGTAAENPIAFLRNSKLGAKDLSILTARKDIPREIRELWGEVESPLENYANSVGKMSHLLANHAFLSRVRAEGMGKFLFKDPTGDYSVKIADEGNAGMKPLAGLRTTPEIKRAFEEAFAKANLSPAMEAYMRLVAGAKLSKVVLSHTGQARNFLSNIGTAIRNGWWRGGKLPEAWSALRKDTPQARAYWRRMIELGVVGESVHYNDFQKTVEDAFSRRDEARQQGLPEIDTKLMRLWDVGVEAAKKTYHYGDSFWKVYGFENEKANYEKAGYTPEAAEAKAAELVRDLAPTYSKILPGLQKLRRLPFAPFFSFQSEMVRTTLNTFKQIAKEINDPNKAIKAIGYKRLAGTAAAAALPLGVMAAFRAFNNVTSEEEKAVRRFLPDYQKQSSLLFYSRDAKGAPQYIDLSRVDPHAYIGDAVHAFIRGADSGEALKGAENALKEAARPFVAEELLLRPVFDIARNEKEPGGKVYNPEANRPDTLATVASSIAEPFVPGAYTPARRLWKALAGSSEQKTGQVYEKGPAIAENLTGMRLEDVDRERQLENKARGFDRALSDANRMTGELIRAKGSVTPQELEQARLKTAEARQRIFAEMKKDVDAAETLGLTRGEVVKILKDAGVSVEDIVGVLRGVTPADTPKPTGGVEQRQRAVQVRGANLTGNPLAAPQPSVLVPQR